MDIIINERPEDIEVRIFDKTPASMVTLTNKQMLLLRIANEVEITERLRSYDVRCSFGVRIPKGYEGELRVFPDIVEEKGVTIANTRTFIPFNEDELIQPVILRLVCTKLLSKPIILKRGYSIGFMVIKKLPSVRFVITHEYPS